MVKLLLNPNSELCTSLDLDGFMIADMSRLHLRRVPTIVRFSFRSFSAKGTVVKKLSMVILRPTKISKIQTKYKNKIMVKIINTAASERYIASLQLQAYDYLIVLFRS